MPSFGFGNRLGLRHGVLGSSGPPGVPPSVTTGATLSGTPTFGQTLTAVDAVFAGDPTIVVTRKWQRRKGGVWSDIAGATGLTYVVALADYYHDIRVVSRGQNSAGVAISNSSALTVDDEESETSPVFALHLHDGYNDTSGRLFQDAERMTPAVNSGDPVMVVYDPVSGNRALSVAGYTPILRFNWEGTPYLAQEWSANNRFIYVETRAWQTGKRGSFYFAFNPGDSHLPKALIDTAPIGSGNRFTIYSCPITQGLVGTIAGSAKYLQYVPPVAYTTHQDWEWEAQAICRNADATVGIHFDGNFVGNAPIDDNQPANNYLYFGVPGIGEPAPAGLRPQCLGSLVYSASGTYDARLDRIVRARKPKNDPYQTFVIFDGDSIMASSAISFEPFSSIHDMLRAEIADPTWGFRCMAIGGASSATLAPIASARIDANWPATATTCHLIMGTQSNLLYTGAATPEQCVDNLETYCLARKAAKPGLKITVVDMLSRSNAGTPPDFNTHRADYNSQLASRYTAFADYLAAWSADSIMGVNGAETNTSYFLTDLAHPNKAGNTRLMPFIKNQIKP